MEALILAEVLDRRGHVLQRVRVGQLPFRIGRAYANDLILDDPHVSPLHARLERDERGGLVLLDLDSTNGILRAKRRERGERFEVNGEDVFQLGRTLLRFRSADHAVPEAIHFRLNVIDRIERHAAWTWLAIPVVMLAILVDGYRSTYDEVEWLDLWRSALSILLGVAAWAGAWALVSRILSQRAHLAAHWTIGCALALGLQAIDACVDWLQFLVPSLVGVEVFELALQLTLASVGLHAHLSAAGVLARSRHRALAAGAVSVAVLGLVQLNELAERPDFVSVLPYWSRLEPLDPRWLAPESADAFFARADELRVQVDELATEPPTP
jgi:hypothetical protein